MIAASTLRIMGIAVAVVVILNFILMAFRRIPPMVFWIVVILCAIFAYKVLPLLRKKAKQ